MSLVTLSAMAATAAAAAAEPCNLAGVWHGHPSPSHHISPVPIAVTQAAGASQWFALGKTGSISPDFRQVSWGGLDGEVAANTALNASAAPCTRIEWQNEGHTFWCKEPWCDAIPDPDPPLPPRPPPVPPPKGAMNVMFIAVDDLRAQFGRAFQDEEVLTPHMVSGYQWLDSVVCIGYYKSKARAKFDALRLAIPRKPATDWTARRNVPRTGLYVV